MSDAVTREETLLNAIATGETVDIVPVTRKEKYLRYLAGIGEKPSKPITREEMFLDKIQAGGGSGEEEASLLDSLITGSIKEISSNVKIIGDKAFSNRKKLLSVSFPLAETVGDNSFVDCEKLTTINLPKASTIKRAAFENCTSLKKIDLSSATNFGLGYTFLRCYALETVYLGGAYRIPTGMFNNCYSLKNLVIRDTKFVHSYNDLFDNCHHMKGTVDVSYNPNGDRDGRIYVPSALIEEYKAATNWSTYASQFRALEDYTVDGTITGELDESKI